VIILLHHEFKNEIINISVGFSRKMSEIFDFCCINPTALIAKLVNIDTFHRNSQWL